MENSIDNLTDIQNQNAASEPIVFLVKMEQEFQRQLNDYKNELQKKLEGISFDYEEKLNQIKSDCQKEILEIPQTYKKEIEEIQNEYKEKLEAKLEEIEQDWINSKTARESLFLETIQRQDFYD